MSQDRIVEEYGKFLYIEPNNLNGDGIDNAIPHDYEDYSMSVNLEVKIPRRDACGSEDGTKTIYFSSDNGTISFFGGSGGGDGEQGYLTTNYTDVSVTNVGEGNKECLGIKSIEINYDSWFFPMVVINFVDVRGASLMMPQEEAFYQTQLSNDKDSLTQLNGGSFFKALFSFPQPLFKLTVKGFYGRPAVYNLAVLDFKSNFNSQTGNFECRVQFKGYMYGVYADIPMTLLSVAPYINAEKNDHNEYWKGFYFIDENGEPACPMLTYPEFKLAVTSAGTNFNRYVAQTQAGINYAKLQKKKTALQDIRDKFNSIFNDFLIGNVKDSESTYSGVTYFFLAKNEKDVNKYNDPKSGSFNDLLKLVNGFDKSAFSEDDAKSLHDNVEEPLKKGLKKVCTLSVGISSVNGKTVRSWIFNGGKYSFVDSKTNKTKVLESPEGLYPYISGLKEKLNSYLNSDASNVILYGIEFKSDVNSYFADQITKYDKSEESFQTELNKERINQLKNILGFLPSIQNMFNMTFAHMETFINNYYKMLDNISTQMTSGERKAEKFGITGKNDSDLPSANAPVPPFPLFVSEVIENGTHIQRVVPPWEFKASNSEMEEVKFVDRLIEAAKLFTDKQREIDETINKASEVEKYPSTSIENLVPVTPYDFNNAETFNPYASVAETGGSGEDKALQTIITFFLRAYYFYYIFDDLNGNDAEKYFARMEAINFRKAVPQMTKELRENFLKKFNGVGGGNLALSYLLKEKKGTQYYWDIFSNTSAITTDNFFTKKGRGDAGLRFSYDWLKMKDGNGKDFVVLPIGEFNLNKIKNDISTEAYVSNDDTKKKYLTLQDGEITDITTQSGLITNSGSFNYYIGNGNYFDKLFQHMKNADDDIPNVRDKIINKIQNSTSSSISKRPYVFGKHVVNYTEKDGTVSGRTLTTTDGTVYENLFCEYSYENKEKYTYYNFEKADKKELSDTSVYGVVGDGTAIANNMTDSLYTGSLSDLYKGQEDGEKGNMSKAYLYIMSIPLNTNLFYGKKAPYGEVNCETLLTMLLREGAFWWRKEYEGEPIKWDSITGYKAPTKDEIPIIEMKSMGSGYYSNTQNGLKPNTLSLIKTSDSLNRYIKWEQDDERISTSRKRSLAKLFQDWANDSNKFGFINIKNHLEKYDTKGIQDVLYDFFKMKATIMDTAERVDKKAGGRKLGYDKLRQSFNKFIDELNRLYRDKTNDVESSDDNRVTTQTSDTGSQNDDEVRFSTYLTLKSLYDKWFCGKDRKTWYLPRNGVYTEESDFKNMHFIDSYYNEIGTRIICNTEHISDMIEQYMPSEASLKTATSTEYNIQSMYSFLSDICEKCGMVLMSLPLMYGLNPNDRGAMEDMFDTIPFSKEKEKMNDGQTYLCVYSYKPSEHLDLSNTGEYNYEYVNDSFDIADVTGRRSSIFPSTLEDVTSDSSLRIPAFGVTYAKQNQSYFKNIGVNMDNPQVTEASLAMEQLIASKGGNGPRQIAIYGQDLYRVYSNYSYTCNVDMMGNSQVMPLMYFQLNNIPMFRGAYMITKVVHNISAGNMTTQFTGVRQNKYATPIAAGKIILLNTDGMPYGMEGPSSVYTNGTPITEYKPVIPDGIFDCDVAIEAMNKPHTYGNAISICGATNYSSYHKCAEWVKYYAKTAGAKYFENVSVGYAWNMRKLGHMENAGFACVDTLIGTRVELQTLSEQRVQRGDIAIMPHNSKDIPNDQDAYGHVCMWNDTLVWKDGNGNTHTGAWVSDFVQTPKDGVKQKGGVSIGSPWVYGGEDAREIYIYRWNGTRKIGGRTIDINGNPVKFNTTTYDDSTNVGGVQQTEQDPKEKKGGSR